MRAPRLLPVLAAGLLLAGCGLQQPTPYVSVVSGGSTAHAQAVSYCFEGQQASADGAGCTKLDEKTEVLRFTPGDQVGIDVAKKVSANWAACIGSGAPQAQPCTLDQNDQQQAVVGQFQKDHYATFQPPNTLIKLRVFELAPGATTDQASAPATRGTWEFLLAPR